MKDRITNFIDLDTAVRQFQDAIISAYNDNCPSLTRRYNRNISWWNQDLADRSKVHRLLNAEKKSGYWTDYKIPTTEYNNALRQAKRQSWRRQCEEIENAPKCARLQMILSKGGQSAVSSLQLENGEYTKTENETLEELL